jgi:hypothetical protein
VAGRAVTPLQPSQDAAHRFRADLGRELLDSRERDRPEGGLGCVVVADDRHVPGNPHAGLRQSLEHAEGAHVVARDDGRHAIVRGKELPGRFVRAALGERGMHDADPASQLVPGHGGPVAFDPLSGGVLRGIGNHRDSVVPKRCQMVDDQPCADPVIADYTVDPRDPGGVRQRDQRRRPRRCCQGRAGKPFGHRDDAVHLQFQETSERVLLGLAPPLAADHQAGVPALFGHGVNPVEHHGKERVVQVTDQHPDRLRLTARQRPRGRVRPVAEFLDRAENSSPGRLAHKRRIAEHT